MWLSFNAILHLYKNSWVSVNVAHHQLRYPFSLSLAADHSEFVEIPLSAMAAWKWVSFSLWSVGHHLSSDPQPLAGYLLSCYGSF